MVGLARDFFNSTRCDSPSYCTYPLDEQRRACAYSGRRRSRLVRPLSTAVINFSKEPFPLAVGEPFFRLLFIRHSSVSPTSQAYSQEEYTKIVLDQVARYSETFLNFDTLVPEIADRMFHLRRPGWVLFLTLTAVLLAFLAIFVPIAVTVWGNDGVQQARLLSLETQVQRLFDMQGDQPLTSTVKAGPSDQLVLPMERPNPRASQKR